MGAWAQSEFGRETLPKRCYLIAGGTPRETVEIICNEFDEVLVRHHDVYERCLVRTGEAEAILAFQLYGAPVVADFLNVLKDGGTEEVIFLGLAQGKGKDIQVGDYVIPTQTQCCDGIAKTLGSEDLTEPDLVLVDKVSEAMKSANLEFTAGLTVSVPATFWHGDESKHASDVIALECEFATFCHCSKELGLSAAGLFVISDTEERDLLDDSRLSPHPRMVQGLQAIKDKLT